MSEKLKNIEKLQDALSRIESKENKFIFYAMILEIMLRLPLSISMIWPFF